MPAPRSIVLILGAGSNIGAALASKFTSSSYRVALVSRSAASPPALVSDDVLSIRADLSLSSASTPAYIFTTVKHFFGAAPSVVIYNAAHVSPPPEEGNLFSISPQAVEADLSLMVLTPWAFAAEACGAWKVDPGVEAKEGGKKGKAGGRQRFIYTGNGMAKHVLPMAELATLGTSKSAAAYWVQVADALYRGNGWRFFYADERTGDGKGIGPNPGADSHAEFYLKLVEGEEGEELPSYVTFVQGSYVKF